MIPQLMILQLMILQLMILQLEMITALDLRNQELAQGVKRGPTDAGVVKGAMAVGMVKELHVT